MAWSSSPAEKNPWEGRAYLETLHDSPGRFSDASSFSSESICSCQGGGFLQPSNYLNALPSRKNTLLVLWKKKQLFFLRSRFLSPLKKLYRASRKGILLLLWSVWDSCLGVLEGVESAERSENLAIMKSRWTFLWRWCHCSQCVC